MHLAYCLVVVRAHRKSTDLPINSCIAYSTCIQQGSKQMLPRCPGQVYFPGKQETFILSYLMHACKLAFFYFLSPDMVHSTLVYITCKISLLSSAVGSLTFSSNPNPVFIYLEKFCSNTLAIADNICVSLVLTP